MKTVCSVQVWKNGKVCKEVEHIHESLALEVCCWVVGRKGYSATLFFD